MVYCPLVVYLCLDHHQQQLSSCPLLEEMHTWSEYLGGLHLDYSKVVFLIQFYSISINTCDGGSTVGLSLIFDL
jgi:hypothetical protein